jgi:hypothetical protein
LIYSILKPVWNATEHSFPDAGSCAIPAGLIFHDVALAVQRATGLRHFSREELKFKELQVFCILGKKGWSNA